MSPAENKRAKRRKNKKGRSGLKNSETHPNSSSEGSTPNQDSKMIEEIQEVLDRELVASLPVAGAGQHCLLCHCEKTDDAQDERGIGDGCADDDKDIVAQLPLWVCQECKRSVEVEQQRCGFDSNRVDYMMPPNRDLLAFVAESADSVNGEHSPCHCEACRERRVIEVEQAQEQQELRNFWQELKQAVHQMYRDAGLPLGEASQQLLPPAVNRPLPDTEQLKYMVQRLCRHDPHRLYQCLEAQVKLFIVEMRLRLLRHLVSGQPNKSFICAMLEEYAKLCSASCKIAPIVEELETNHLKSFNLTWELVNRHLFQSIVYADSILNARVIEFFTQQRLNGNREKGRQDPFSAITKFDDEMTVISVVWIEAQQLIEEYNQGQAAVRVKKRLLRKDWERFKAQWKLVEEEILNKPSSYFQRCPCEECQSSHVHNSTHMTSGLLTPTELVSLAEQADGTATFAHGTMSHRGCSKSSVKSALSVPCTWPPYMGQGECLQNTVATPPKEGFHTKLPGASPGQDHSCPMSGTKSEQCHSSLPCGRHDSCFCDNVNGEIPCRVTTPIEEGSPPKPLHRDDKGEDGDQNKTVGQQISRDTKLCECHACVQQQELSLITGSHTANSGHVAASFPLLPHLGEVSRSGTGAHSAKSLIHPHLYNVHVRKNGKQAHHLPWAVNLELETQEVLQEQINLATYGDWDSDFDDTRTVLAHHKHGGNFLGSYNLPPPHNSFPISPNSSSRSRSDSASDGSTCSGLHNMATQANIPDGPIHSLFRGAPPQPTSTPCTNAGTSPIRSSANGHSDLDLSPPSKGSSHNNGPSKDQKLLTDGFGSLPPPECPLVNGRHLQNNQSMCCDGHIPEGEESIDDSCSEQSSSTSTSNQRESRVCDCCYCEVFGHGVPVVAPVSRNYPEMRDRLRLRLSKRKAEGVSTAVKPMPEKNEQVVDNRALEELLKYINGTEENNKMSGTKAAKKQRKKLKKVEERSGKDLPLETESTCFSELASYRDAFYHENHCQFSGRTESPISSQQNPFPECSSVNVNCMDSPKTKLPDKPIEQDVPEATCATEKNLKNSQTEANTTNGNKSMAAEGKATPPPVQNSPKKILNGIVKGAENGKSKSKQLTNKHCLSPVMSRHSMYNPDIGSVIGGPLKKETSRSAENLHVSSQNQINSALTKEPSLQQGAKSTVRTKKNKKKKNSADDTTSPDDIFMPKDIDLENGELDEIEKELEAFKRFCFNSKPLANKEKVHVNMKDLVIKRRPAFSANVPSAQKL